jgi:hypothetical protein
MDLRKSGQYPKPSSQISHSIRRRKKRKPDPMVGIRGSHSKTPSTSSLQHAAQHSHPPQRSGQPPESPQFSTSLPSPIGGGGRASNSSFSAQSQQHSKHPSRLPKLSLNTKVSSLPRPSMKPLLVSSPATRKPFESQSILRQQMVPISVNQTPALSRDDARAVRISERTLIAGIAGRIAGHLSN